LPAADLRVLTDAAVRAPGDQLAMTALCRLDACAGRERLCPEAGCPFWEPGGAALAGRCVFEGLDFAGRSALVAELVRIRQILKGGEPGDEELRARHAFQQLLNESVEE
jgi:hypothetical protein